MRLGFSGIICALAADSSVGITVLCEKFDWNKDGVDILGPVSINTGGSFLAFPLRAENRKYITQTTSTAMSVPSLGLDDVLVLTYEG